MSLEFGDTIRLIKDTFGFRKSAMYSSIDVKANSYAVVIESEFTTGYEAAILRYVKKRDTWKKTKVIIQIKESGDVLNFGGEGNRWVRTNLLDKLVLTSDESVE